MTILKYLKSIVYDISEMKLIIAKLQLKSDAYTKKQDDAKMEINSETVEASNVNKQSINALDNRKMSTKNNIFIKNELIEKFISTLTLNYTNTDYLGYFENKGVVKEISSLNKPSISIFNLLFESIILLLNKNNLKNEDKLLKTEINQNANKITIPVQDKIELNSNEIRNLENIDKEKDKEKNNVEKNEIEVLESNKIYKSLNIPYKIINVGQTKLPISKNIQISYITICSSVASSGTASQRLEDDTSNTKSALFGSADDAQNVSKLLMNFGRDYMCMGNYSFSKDSLSSVPKEIFLNSIKNFFDNQNSDGCMIYYSGHGFPDTSLMLETSQGSYYVFYDDIINLWRNRAYPNKNAHLLIILDCCYSGSWVKRLLETGDFIDVTIQASSTEDQKSLDLGMGKGSLYTNALLYSNLKLIKKKSIEINIDFSNKELEQKLLSQQPRGAGIESYRSRVFNLKGVKINSWQEIIDDNSPIWNRYLFKETQESPISCIMLAKIETNLVKNFHEKLILCKFKEGKISIQGELDADKPSCKYLFRMSIYCSLIENNKKGYSAIFNNNKGETQTLYFNTFSKVIMTFERNPEETDTLINLVRELISYLIGNSNKIDTILRIVNDFKNIITVMDKTSLKQQQTDDETNEEEINFSEHIERIVESQSSKLKSICIKYIVDPGTIISLFDFINNNKSNIESIGFIAETSEDEVDDNILLKNHEIKIPKNILKLEISFKSSKKYYFIEEVPILSRLEDVSINFSGTDSSSFNLKNLQLLYFSETLINIELIGLNNCEYQAYLPKFADIKSLKVFSLKKSTLFIDLKGFMLTTFNNNTKESEVANQNFYIKRFFQAFKDKSNLTSFTVSGCFISGNFSINNNLNYLDFSDNNIYDSSFELIIDELSKFKNKFRVNLSNNLFSSNILNSLKSYLVKNTMCLEFNISDNDIREEDMIKLVKYNINQNNSISSLNVSGTYFCTFYKALIDVLKNNKQLKHFIARGCKLNDEIFMEMSQIFTLESFNSIISLDLSNNKIFKCKVAENVIRNFAFSTRLVNLELENVFNLEDNNEAFNLVGLFNIKTLETLNINKNNCKFGFILVESKVRLIRENLKSLKFAGTKILKVDLTKVENLDHLEIDDYSLNILFGLKSVANLTIHMDSYNSFDCKLLFTAETIVFTSKLSKISSEQSEMLNDDSDKLTRQDKTKEVIKQIIEINTFNNTNNEIKDKKLKVDKVFDITANNIDKEAYNYLSNYINLNRNSKFTYTLDERFISNNITSNYSELNAYLLDKKTNFSEISSELKNYLNKLNVKPEDTELLISKSPYTVYDNQKYLIINYNYLDWNKFDALLEYNFEYLQLNTVYLKEFLKILDKNITKIKNLKVFVISNSEINAKELNSINLLLQQCKDTIKELHLVNTYIDGKESAILFKGLQKLKNITCLNLSNNIINKSFAIELIFFLTSNRSIKELILEETAMTSRTLNNIFESVDSDIKLDLSGLKLCDSIKTTLNFRNENKCYVCYYIGSNTNIFKNTIDIHDYYNKYNLFYLELDKVNYKESISSLSQFVQGFSSIRRLKVNKSQKEATIFYYLKKIFENTIITELDISYCIINKNNVDDLIKLIIIQKKLSSNALQYLNISNTQLEDYSFMKLLTCFTENSILNTDMSNNMLTKSSLLAFYDLKKYNLINNIKANYVYKASFIGDFDLDRLNYKKCYEFSMTIGIVLNQDFGVLYGLKCLEDTEQSSYSPNITINNNPLNLKIYNPSGTGKCELAYCISELSTVQAMCKMTDNSVLCGISDNIIYIQLSEKSIIANFIGHTNCVTVICRINEELFISGSHDGSIRLWSVDTLKCLQVFEEHISTVGCLCKISEEKFISGNNSSSIKIWSTKSSSSIATLLGHNKAIEKIVKLSDDEFVSSEDSTIIIWSLITEAPLYKLLGYSQFEVSISINQSYLYAISSDSKLVTWDLNKKLIIKTFDIKNENNCQLKLYNISKDEILIFFYNSFKIWNTQLDIFTIEISTSEEINNNTILSFCKLTNKMFLIGTTDGKINAYSYSPKSYTTEYKEHTMLINSVCKNNENSFLSGAEDCQIKLWNLNESKSVKSTKTTVYPTSLCRMSDSIILVGLSNGYVNNFNTNDGIIDEFNIHSGSVSCIVKCEDDIFVTPAYNELSILGVYSLSQRSLLYALIEIAYIELLIKVNDEVYVTAFDKSINLISFSNKNCFLSLSLNTESAIRVTCMCPITQDIFVSGSNFNEISVWSLKENGKICDLESNGLSIRCIAKISDEMFASGTEFCKIYLWSLNSRVCIAEIEEHSGSINSICCLNEEIIISGSDDHTIKVWCLNNLLN